VRRHCKPASRGGSWVGVGERGVCQDPGAHPPLPQSLPRQEERGGQNPRFARLGSGAPVGSAYGATSVSPPTPTQAGITPEASGIQPLGTHLVMCARGGGPSGVLHLSRDERALALGTAVHGGARLQGGRMEHHGHPPERPIRSRIHRARKLLDPTARSAAAPAA
jgi:hypothetical protein